MKSAKNTRRPRPWARIELRPCKKGLSAHSKKRASIKRPAMRFQAEQHNEKANKLEERGQIEKAIAYYEKAIKTDPHWSVPWYNLGLLYKRQRAWERSLKCNQRAVKLDPR